MQCLRQDSRMTLDKTHCVARGKGGRDELNERQLEKHEPSNTRLCGKNSLTSIFKCDWILGVLAGDRPPITNATR